MNDNSERLNGEEVIFMSQELINDEVYTANKFLKN